MVLACPPIHKYEDERGTNTIIGGISMQLICDFLEALKGKPITPRDFLTAVKMLASMEGNRRQLIRVFNSNLDTSMIIGRGLYCTREPHSECLIETGDAEACEPGKCPRIQAFEAELFDLAFNADDPITAVGMQSMDEKT